MSTTTATPVVLGSTLPRLWTRPLVVGPPGPCGCGCGCALTPETSYGFEVDEFARDTLRKPLDPWERWAAIHGGELLADGTPRFTTLVILVARQNGKTHLLVVLILFWLFRARKSMILGTSTQVAYAKESWLKAVKLAKSIPELRAGIPTRGGVRKANGEVELVYAPSGDVDDLDACRYKIAAANEEGGRSLSIDRLVADELRQHHTYDAWEAAEPTTSAVEGSQIWGLSNAGDARSVVLNDLQDAAREFIEWWDEQSGERGVAELLAADDCPGDYRLGLFEWSAPEDADPTDVHALAQANPNMNIRKDGSKLLAAARRAVRLGGRPLTGFKTEHMCIRVKQLDPAIDPDAWTACRVPAPVDVEQRQRLAACVDLSLDETHATLSVAVVLDDDRVRVETVHEWSGPDAASQMERELPGWAERIRPRVLGWYPGGPAAAVAGKLTDRRKEGVRGWPPRGVRVAEIRGEVTAVCMGLGKEVKARTLVHSGQEMLDTQVSGAEKLRRGDGWVFTRAGGDRPVDAVYSVAGAAHLARTLPKPRKVARRTGGGR